MSFDIVLYRGHDAIPLQTDEVDSCITAIPNVRRTVSDIRQYICDDAETGQSYNIVLSRGASHDPHVVGPTLDVSLDYSLPIPVVEGAAKTVFHIADRLRLRIHMSQVQTQMAEPHEADDIVRAFATKQEAATQAARGNRLTIGLIKISREKAEYVRAYNQRRSVIEDSPLGLDVHVPDQLFLMHPVSSDSAVHVVRWPDCIPMVFPQVDYVLVARDKRGLFGLPIGRETGLVPFAEIARLLGKDLVRVDEPVVHYVYKRPEPRPEVKKAVERLHLISLTSFAEPEPQDVVEL